jgi:hypothetical protein
MGFSQRLLFGILAPIGNAAGSKSSYPEISDPKEHDPGSLPYGIEPGSRGSSG